MSIKTFFKTFRIMYKYNNMLDTLKIMKNNLKLLKKELSNSDQTENR
ncbi:MAG: hypothetical protein HFJ43_04340 [Clostridia bacterium]|nr:hypothetical protein [Clostridia bacterium]